MRGGVSPPDPYVLRAKGVNDNFAGISFKTTSGLTARSTTINPAIKTLVLITSGQSNWANVVPTAFAPVNSTVVDQMNIFDGAIYSITSSLLGSTQQDGLGTSGYSNVSTRLADLLVTNGKFDRVIIVSIAINATAIADWGLPSGDLYNRTQVAMARLASRGIVPGVTGVTFACVFGLGENDNLFGTNQADFTTGLNGFTAALFATGFNGRLFIPQETYIGHTSSDVRAAQAAAVNGTTIFFGGDLDTLTSTNRQADSVHFSDTGAAAAATLVYNAMHATGSPF